MFQLLPVMIRFFERKHLKCFRMSLKVLQNITVLRYVFPPTVICPLFYLHNTVLVINFSSVVPIHLGMDEFCCKIAAYSMTSIHTTNGLAKRFQIAFHIFLTVLNS